MSEAHRDSLLGCGEKPRLLAARICVRLGWLQIALCVIILCIHGTGPMDTAPAAEIRLFDNAKTMLVPAMLLEVCYLISARSSKYHIQLHGYETSHLLILEFLVKIACYSVMSHYNGGIVHRNMLATGPPRPCYTTRFIAWSVAVPTLMAINNFPLLGARRLRETYDRLWPNLFVTVSYLFTGWVAQVTPNSYAAYVLVTLSITSFVAALVDQVDLMADADPNMIGLRFKKGVVILKQVMFAAYGVVYVAASANQISSFWEQFFFTYGDVLLKVVHASVLVVVRNREDLEELHQDMSRLFRRASAPIFAVSWTGHIVAWNEHLARVSGILEEEALGKDILELVKEESKEQLLQGIESCKHGLSSGALEVVLNRGSNDGQPVQMLLTLIVQHGNEPGDTITAIGQDLTEVTKLKAMQERKTRFTAVLGHELRSPLHGIMGLSGMMADAATDKALKKQLSMIKGCAARLLDLVTNIMEMAKAERSEASGNLTITRAPVNTIDVVAEVLGMTEMAVDKSGKHLVKPGVVIINKMATGTLPIVMGDGYKITQLLYNLVTNASKFTSAGSIEVSARENKEEGMLELEVADTGPGISPDSMVQIFEPFKQEDSTEPRGFQGIGLGLSVAMSIAKLHGGSIRVRSTVGQGSAFTVALPCDMSTRVGPTMRPDDDAAAGTGAGVGAASQVVTARAAPAGVPSAGKTAAPAAVPARGLPWGGAVAVPGKLPLILSVDDDEVNQEVIERNLGSHYRIVRAMSGMEALEYLDSGKELPSLMLLDVMMPGMSGFAVARQLRSARGITHMQLPVVMLSARAPEEATACEALQSGATDYMSKPFSCSVLKLRLSMIEEWRQEQRVVQPATAAPRGDDKARSPTAPAAAAHADSRAGGGGIRLVAAEAAEVLEAIARLKDERDGLTARLAEQEREASENAAALSKAQEERDLLKEELAQSEWCANAGPKNLPSSSRASTSASGSSRSLELDLASAAAEFYKHEVEHLERQILRLRDKVNRHKSDAWVHRNRAEAAGRFCGRPSTASSA